jgi:hypothetical protein
VRKRKYLCGLFDDVSPSLLHEHFLQINLKERLDQNLKHNLAIVMEGKQRKKKGKQEMGGLLVVVQVSNRWGLGR